MCSLRHLKRTDISNWFIGDEVEHLRPPSNVHNVIFPFMTILLASRELDLLGAVKFALECRRFRVLLATRAADTVNYISANGVDLVALDVAMDIVATPRIVEQVKNGPRSAEVILILFGSRAQLRAACADRGMLNKADEVLVDMFDESDLIDKIASAARRLRVEKSEYYRHNSEWQDPYATNPFEERRRQERFTLEVPVVVKGKDKLGEPFEEQTSIINVSGGGAYLRSEYHLEENTSLEVSIRSPKVPNGLPDLRGTIVRMEQGNDRHEPKRRRAALRFNDDVQQNMEFHLALAKLSSSAYSRGGVG